jgi:HD-GYP domain-containing protein (c-di-GMP phosphodiesterase class II)
MASKAPSPLPENGRAATSDPEAEALIEQTRARARGQSELRDRLASFLIGGMYLIAAVTALLLLPTGRHASPFVVAVYVGCYAAVSRVEFEIGRGASVPTELVLVPMLFVLPLNTLPVCVAAGLALRDPWALVRGGWKPERLFVLFVSCWHAFGPVLFLVAAHAFVPTWRGWPLYTGALLAQFVFDFAATSLREWLAFGASPVSRWRFMGWVYLVDSALAPAGLALAFVASVQVWAIATILPLVGLFGLFARERRGRIDHALQLSKAYRGTALLLGDMIEADDAYTGKHSRDVVSLTLAVADRLRLSQRALRDAEFAALLHDVGKIRIPPEIISKPGSLDPQERAIIETHTIEGEQLLNQVGGVLGDVGSLVRSCHERWDGDGYPDGLAGEQIPLVARIVCCCDAFDAMTSDRPYRRARSVEAAVDELRREAGRQFDPRVVAALIEIILEDAGADQRAA